MLDFLRTITLRQAKAAYLALALPHAGALPSIPSLHVNLPQNIAAIQAASPGVHITPTYGGNAGVSYWKVSTPVRLVGATGACAFELALTSVPSGAASLTGTPDGTVHSLQVDSFGNMPEAQALTAAQKLSTDLEAHGWVPTASERQHTPGELHTLLASGPAVSLRNLSCGGAHINFSVQQTTGRLHNVTYSFLYEQP